MRVLVDRCHGQDEWWGCARESVMSRPQAVTVSPVVGAPSALPSCVEEHTMTTQRTVEPEPSRGVFSTAVHIVGEILSLPFRLVGALLRVIV